ncbi:MAG TPA: glycosyltransferase [Chlamydiales bacterium]|nr:glycosyltransferase [Chlamydiales bacterium]
MIGSSIDLTIVIPVYNEDRNISATLLKLKEHLSCSCEILIVFDFDEDTTVPVAQKLICQYPNMRLIKNNVARGPSGAIRTGFNQAQGSNILVLMADLCDDVTQIPEMLRLMAAGVDVVSPSRYCRGGSQVIQNVVLFKIWIPKIANFLLRYIIGIPTSDSTNSFKMYSAKLVKNMKLQSTVSFSVTLEIVVKAHCLGGRIKDIPTIWRDRQHGKSNFKVFRSLFVYLPWFLLAFFHSRLIRLPRKWWQKRFSSQAVAN